MLQLRPVTFDDVQHWFWDFQKKSLFYGIPSPDAGYMGIFKDNSLIGYFVLGVEGKDINILQGYLDKAHRHTKLPRLSMALLETVAKTHGYERIRLCTHNRFKSYLKFADSLGYKPEQFCFSKEVR